MTRHFWVLFHRYAGLFMAFFLIVIGLTGSIIVFNPELNNWLNPPPIVAKQDKPMLDAYTLRDRAQALEPHAMVNGLNFQIKPDEPYYVGFEPRIDPATGKPYELNSYGVYLDPYAGAELKREVRNDDIWPITHKNIMNLINRLHYQLALPGMFGSYLFGIVALVWTIDCFVSGYLTFPVSVRRRENDLSEPGKPARKSWIKRWWNPAWLVKWNGSTYRINFDLHRAGGLWVWIMLLALAWSSVGFNLSEQIYHPVMKAAFNMPDPFSNFPKVDKPQLEPGLGLKEAHAIARRLMAEQAEKHGFKVQYEDSLDYFSEYGAYMYAVRSDRDLMDHSAATYLLFDAINGKFGGINIPTGANAGNTIDSWIFALHMAQIWGLPFRIFVTVMGLVITMLSITGVYIWLKKRNARHISQVKHSRLVEEENLA